MSTNTTSSTNFDPAELAKFSALAHRWWDPTSEFRPLHEINPLRLAHVARLAKPGGMVFYSTINRNAKSFLFAIVGAEHVLKLLPAGTHEYARFIRPSELSRACRDAGLRIVDLTGMTYNPFTKTYSLGRDVDVN